MKSRFLGGHSPVAVHVELGNSLSERAFLFLRLLLSQGANRSNACFECEQL